MMDCDISIRALLMSALMVSAFACSDDPSTDCTNDGQGCNPGRCVEVSYEEFACRPDADGDTNQGANNGSQTSTNDETNQGQNNGSQTIAEYTCCLNGAFYECPNGNAVDQCGDGNTTACQAVPARNSTCGQSDNNDGGTCAVESGPCAQQLLLADQTLFVSLALVRQLALKTTNAQAIVVHPFLTTPAATGLCALSAVCSECVAVNDSCATDQDCCDNGYAPGNYLCVDLICSAVCVVNADCQSGCCSEYTTADGSQSGRYCAESSYCN